MFKQTIVKFLGFFLVCILLGFFAQRLSSKSSKYAQFLKAYSRHIKTITHDAIIWHDGTSMPLYTRAKDERYGGILENPTLAEQIEQATYLSGLPSDLATYKPTNDSGRIRYEPFFRKMYGNSPSQVEKNLVEVVWMPKIFGKNTYKLLVTTIHDIDKKIQAISDELEELVAVKPEYADYLKNPGGTYKWRVIANTDRLSNHSFGMTLDINADLSHYWQWDLEKENKPIKEDTQLEYKNIIPREIVLIFEKYGFIWGGKWQHYDTMHFEFRPELFEHYTL